MSRFHELLVTDVHKTTREASVVTLQPRDPARFEFVPGQYLTFRHLSDTGEDLRRSYSLCSAPHEGVLQVGIKRVEGGLFSTWANDALRAGMTLEAMEPMGGFHQPLADNATEQRRYLAFAVGSGITPVLSIMKALLTQEPRSRFTLVFANRSINTIMFRDELEDLKNHFLGRLTIVHILKTGGDDAALFQGRLNRAKCDELLERWIDARRVDQAYICGPEPMMLEIAASLRARGLDDAQIRFELFGSAPQNRRPRPTKSQAAGNRISATLTLEGATSEVSTTRDTSILDTALENGLDAPYACKAGVCSTCKCKVVRGEVEMIANHALEDYEVAGGYVLSCQAYAVSEAVSVVYEDH